MVILTNSSLTPSRIASPVPNRIPSRNTDVNLNLDATRKFSQNLIDQYSPLLEQRKGSIQSAIQKTKEGLANLFASDEQSPEDLIYNLFRIPNKTDASIGKLIMVLKNYGLQENDPRLEPMMRKIREIEAEKEERFNEAKDPKHWKLCKDDFKRVIGESLSLIAQTLQNDLIVPCWSQFTQIIKEIYVKCQTVDDGQVADYIPQLARFSPKNWGVAICTIDGQRVAYGDSKAPFCIQSVSKAFNYSIAASELGADFVHSFVGQEPSGRLFNEICLDSKDKPHNPMVNSGAIIVTTLIQNKMNIADRFDHMINQYRKISGGEYVGFNNAVFLSEQATADRNFALAYYMKEKGCFPPETNSLKEALDFYFQLCSLEVTCESAAVMAATLANGGVCPITGERCIKSETCRDVLSLMNSCGMYDYSGQFAFHVGLPAKSGVSGIMIVVVPNIMGIALWSPPLDKLGNSCRGVAFCKELIQRFNFHNYDSLAHNETQKIDPRRRAGEREKDQVVSLLFAAKAGDLNTIRRMFMQGCNLEIADYDKRTALHLAASEGHFDVALFLLETAKVRPDPRDRWNRTPLQDAQEAHHVSCALLIERRMEELIKNGGVVDDPNRLTFGSRSGSLNVIPRTYSHTIPKTQHHQVSSLALKSNSAATPLEPMAHDKDDASMNGNEGRFRAASMDEAFMKSHESLPQQNNHVDDKYFGNGYAATDNNGLTPITTADDSNSPHIAEDSMNASITNTESSDISIVSPGSNGSTDHNGVMMTIEENEPPINHSTNVQQQDRPIQTTTNTYNGYSYEMTQQFGEETPKNGSFDAHQNGLDSQIEGSKNGGVYAFDGTVHNNDNSENVRKNSRKKKGHHKKRHHNHTNGSSSPQAIKQYAAHIHAMSDREMEPRDYKYDQAKFMPGSRPNILHPPAFGRLTETRERKSSVGERFWLNEKEKMEEQQHEKRYATSTSESESSDETSSASQGTEEEVSSYKNTGHMMHSIQQNLTGLGWNGTTGYMVNRMNNPRRLE